MPRTVFLIAALVGAVAVAAAVFYWIGGEAGNGAGPPAPSPLAVHATGAVSTFVASDRPQSLPDVRFNGPGGEPMSLAAFEGKVVLLNLWATWCAPCREEMPALDRLEKALGGERFKVVAVSLDRGDAEKARAFLEEIGIEELELYHDPSGRLGSALNVFGMPTTLLIGPNGRELGRLVGPAEWDAPEAQNLVQAAIDETSPG